MTSPFEWAMVAGAVFGVSESMKNRRSQASMAKKARKQRAKEADALREAEESSRTPLAPKVQQLPVQARPKTPARTGGLSPLTIARKKGKAGLRMASSLYGARF